MNKLPIYWGSAMILVALSPMIADADTHLHEHMSECEYTDCNEGICTSYSGTELCNCTGTGRGGLFCQRSLAPWTSGACLNGGSPSWTIVEGEIFCVCRGNFTGPQCQYADYESKCAIAEEGDISFLPKCTLKTSLGIFASCIEGNLPYLDLDANGTNIFKTCRSKVWKTVQCIDKSFEYCGGKQCRDGLYGVYNVYSVIANNTLNPEYPLMQSVHKLLCTPPQNDSGFPDFDETFNIGAPVCKSDIIDRMIAALIAYGNRAIKPGADICSELETLRMQMYQLAADSCDWNNITAVINGLMPYAIPDDYNDYWPSALRMIHQEFYNWKIPQCAGTDSICADYCKNGGTCHTSGDGYSPTCECPYWASGDICQYSMYDQQCEPGYCENGGSCYMLLSGGRSCSCQEMSSGERCEKYDPTVVCPTVADDDVELFPTCTLRSTFHHTVQCMTNLPQHLFGQTDEYTCRMELSRMRDCISTMVADCSRTMCSKSIYNFEGASEAVQGLFIVIYGANFSEHAVRMFCQPHGGQIIIEYIRHALRDMNGTIDAAIGMFCPGYELRDLAIGLEMLIERIGYATNTREVCDVLRTVRDEAFHTLSSRCNLRALGYLKYLPEGYEEIGRYINRTAHVLISILQDFTLPMCRGSGGGMHDSMCPLPSRHMRNSDWLKLYDCYLFEFKMNISNWMKMVFEWMQRRPELINRDWNPVATMLGYYPSYGMGYGENGFIEMVKANMPCGSTHHMDCSRGREFVDALNCRHCHNRHMTYDSQTLFVEWLHQTQQYAFLSTLYKYLSTQAGDYGGPMPTGPPPTGYTTWFSTTTSSNPWPYSTTRPYSPPESSHRPYQTHYPPHSSGPSPPHSATMNPPPSSSQNPIHTTTMKNFATKPETTAMSGKPTPPDAAPESNRPAKPAPNSPNATKIMKPTHKTTTAATPSPP